ncbi:MAG: DUF4091 domain-containing protein, partial [Candidatus Hydrogenedentes bacterium]|nr:DUF4091 domain-containing protein [Candidatus Hydrogenedentota bacterium]
MNALAALMMVSAAAMDVWTQSPMARVFPDSTRPKPTINADHRIYAATGEFESIQVCVRAGKEGLQNVRVTAPAPDNTIPAPVLRRVGYVRIPAPSPRAVGERELWPDPLLAYAPFSLGPDEAASVWVTYAIPRDAKPGLRTSKIMVKTDPIRGKKRSNSLSNEREIELKITVFDFALPETPALRTAFPLDRGAIKAFYGIDDTDLEKWKPIYDALAPYRISFRVWDGTEGLVALNGGQFDSSKLKEHVEYAVNTGHMNSIDVGGGPGGLALFPEPDKTDPAQDPLQAYLRSVAPWLNDVPPGAEPPQDPLQPFLNDIADWLDSHNWLDKAYIEPVVLPDRSLWQTVRDTAFRVRINENRIPRLLEADVHPFFERYTRIWAMPLCRYDPHADERLRQGVSLLDIAESPAESVKASSEGSLPQQAGAHESYTTLSAEACDGSVFTYWVSKDAPTPKRPEWLEVKLKQPVKTDKMRVIWRTGCEAAATSVFSLRDGYPPARLDVQWEERPQVVAYGQTWLLGTLKSPQVLSHLRIEFTESCTGGPVGVSEVIMGDGSLQPPETFEPIEPWLFTHEQDFPSFHVDAHTSEFRLAPWVCFSQRMAGFVHSGLNKWPADWKGLDAGAPILAGSTLNDVLFYPGPDAPIASIRAELLRDGLEDYEYLRLLDLAVA